MIFKVNVRNIAMTLTLTILSLSGGYGIKKAHKYKMYSLFLWNGPIHQSPRICGKVRVVAGILPTISVRMRWRRNLIG